MKPRIQYVTKWSQERFGRELFEVLRLKSLDGTIDALFEELKKTGDERLLEDLCPYFGKVWPSARGLVGFMSSQDPASWKNQRVLEVGCGLALPALLLAKIGARVLATDFHPDVPYFLQQNLEKNLTTDECKNLEYRSMDWKKIKSAEETFSWLIGSDILYERAHFIEVASALDTLAGPSTQIVVADPGRPYLQGFSDELVQRGWELQTHVDRVPDPPDDPLKPGEKPSPDFKDIFILHFRRKKSRV